MSLCNAAYADVAGYRGSSPSRVPTGPQRATWAVPRGILGGVTRLKIGTGSARPKPTLLRVGSAIPGGYPAPNRLTAFLLLCVDQAQRNYVGLVPNLSYPLL